MKPRLGLALGAGSAKGWAHIGVLRALEELGLRPDVVAGTSIGALVGAAYVTDHLDDLEAWVTSLSWTDVLTLLDIRLSGGLIRGDRVINRLSEHLRDVVIEQLSRPFAAVATELDNGNECWLRDGPILDAVRASIALPGLFSPIKLRDRWLVDGGLVNPVPVSLCRAIGADVVIAVDLSTQIFLREGDGISGDRFSLKSREGDAAGVSDRILEMFQGMLGRFRGRPVADDPLPSILDVAIRSLNIMSVRISRSRLAGEPPDLLLSPKVGDIALMEFHRADEAIALGRAEVQRRAPEFESIRHYLAREVR
ncbi:MAG: patatin-like phospholipase RssA [Thiotrichales bacterium]